MKLRCVVLFAMAGACGRQPAATPARDAAVGVTVKPPVAAPDAAPEPAVPSIYTIADDKLAVQIALVPPPGWRDHYDPPGRMAFSTEHGSWLRIGLATLEPSAGTFELSETHQAAIARQVGTRTLGCTIELVKADLAQKDALVTLCTGLDAMAIPDDRMVWKIQVIPASVALADVEQVKIQFTATNASQETLDPGRGSLEVAIDGETSQQLGMAFGNGGRGREWSALPPGKSATDARTGMQLVDAAGDHVISLSRMGHELARTTLHVTP